MIDYEVDLGYALLLLLIVEIIIVSRSQSVEVAQRVKAFDGQP